MRVTHVSSLSASSTTAVAQSTEFGGMLLNYYILTEGSIEKTTCPNAEFHLEDCMAKGLMHDEWVDLFTAIKRGHLPCLKRIWSTGSYKEDGIDHFFKGVITPLVYAAGYGTPEVVEYLVCELGANVNKCTPLTKEQRQNSPLSAAAYNGNFEICEILINNGADISKVKIANFCYYID